MKVSLKYRFLIPTILLLALGMAGVSGFCHTRARNALKDALSGRIIQQSTSTAAMMTQWMAEQAKVLGLISHHGSVVTATQPSIIGEASRQVVSEELASLRRDYEFYETIALADTQGRVIASSGPEGGGAVADVRNARFFAEFLKGNTGIHALEPEFRGNAPVFTIGAPVTDTSGRAVGLIFGVIPFARLHDQFPRHIDTGAGGQSAILSKTQGMVSGSRAGVLADPELIELLLARKSGEIRRSFQGEEYFVVFRPVERTGWVLAAALAERTFLHPIRNNGWVILGIGLSVTLLAALFTIWNANLILNPISRIIHGLEANAAHVSSAAHEISVASQSLAAGVSRQVAALQESSASLQELSSITRKTAENADVTDRSMEEASQEMIQANRLMTELMASMDAISAASRESSKIIKTIDDIAFQTNLLSLNAAVEAARAGETGAGFAVVAEEVRGLAQRSAEAARSTTHLIEETLGKVRDGGQVVRQAHEIFSRMGEGMLRNKGLVTEIAQASREQAQGIEQISQSAAEIDAVTQSGAASAEESASASEEMSGQARQMRTSVGKLTEILIGRRGGGAG